MLYETLKSNHMLCHGELYVYMINETFVSMQQLLQSHGVCVSDLKRCISNACYVMVVAASFENVRRHALCRRYKEYKVNKINAFLQNSTTFTSIFSPKCPLKYVNNIGKVHYRQVRYFHYFSSPLRVCNQLHLFLMNWRSQVQ